MGGMILQQSAPVIGPNRTIFTSVKYCSSWEEWCHHCTLFAMHTNGTLRWQYGDSDFDCIDEVSIPAVSADGTIYFVALGNRTAGYPPFLYSFSVDGMLNWRRSLGSEKVRQRVIKPTVSRLGDCVTFAVSRWAEFHSTGSDLYVFEHNGEMRWRYRSEEEHQGITLMDDNGTVYTALMNGDILAFDAKPIFPPSPSPSPSKSWPTSTVLLCVLLASGVVALMMLACVLFMCRKKSQDRRVPLVTSADAGDLQISHLQ